jgi:hypothetical protein
LLSSADADPKEETVSLSHTFASDRRSSHQPAQDAHQTNNHSATELDCSIIFNFKFLKEVKLTNNNKGKVFAHPDYGQPE